MWWPGCALDINVDAGRLWYGENRWSGLDSILAVLRVPSIGQRMLSSVMRRGSIN
jgi:hypothetical protein